MSSKREYLYPHYSTSHCNITLFNFTHRTHKVSIWQQQQQQQKRNSNKNNKNNKNTNKNNNKVLLLHVPTEVKCTVKTIKHPQIYTRAHGLNCTIKSNQVQSSQINRTQIKSNQLKSNRKWMDSRVALLIGGMIYCNADPSNNPSDRYYFSVAYQHC